MTNGEIDEEVKEISQELGEFIFDEQTTAEQCDNLATVLLLHAFKAHQFGLMQASFVERAENMETLIRESEQKHGPLYFQPHDDGGGLDLD